MSTPSKILLILQFLCFLYFAIFTDILVTGPWLILQIGAAILCVWAVLIMKPGRFNAQPEVKPNAVLISNGPYRLIRNPMYTGLSVFFAVTVLVEHELLHLLIFLLLLVIFLFKIHFEEKFLGLKFGVEYDSYKQKTYRMVPFVF